ncbi:MAG: ribosomal protein S6 modification protein, partial [Gammaproteobacteria bacterium RIFCSPHIGHO2_12_FULL_45_9]
RLFAEAQAQGHHTRILDTLHCYIHLAPTAPTVRYHHESLTNVDAIIPRLSPNMTFYGAAILRQFEAMRTFVLNSSLSITRARDKLRSLQILARKGLQLPITGCAHSPQDIQRLISDVGGPPLIIKLLGGTQGIGVVLADTQHTAESLIQTLLDLKAYAIVQEYIKEAEGADIRCFVIGDQVVAAMKRQARAGDFRSNLHRGGHAEPIALTEQERQVAIAATNALRLNVAGVDLLRSKRGPLILEVNASPGLEGIEKTTELNIAKQIIEYIEKNAKPNTDERYEG